MGGSKGGKSGDSAKIPQQLQDSAQGLIDIGEEQLQIGLPLLQQGGQTSQDVLNTGTSANLRPAILSSVEATRRRGTEEIKNLEQSLTRKGITGTQFQEALAPAQVKRASEVAAVPGDIAAPIFQAATGQALGQTEAGLQSLQSAGTAGAGGAVPGRQSGGLSGAIGGGLSGAASGAQVGSAFGPYGTAIGAIGGGLLGGSKGSK